MDAACHFLLVGQRVGECLGQRFPALLHFAYGLETDLAVAVVEIVDEDFRMCLLLAELYLVPVGHAFAALLLPVVGHGQIEICRPEFGVDLFVDGLCEFFSDVHSVVFNGLRMSLYAVSYKTFGPVTVESSCVFG